MTPSIKAPDCEKIFGEDSAKGRIMPDPATQDKFCTRQHAYWGMWHGQTQLPDSPYAWKYSGGLATYPYQTRPMAVYARAVNRTFFCYGGTTAGNHQKNERRWDFESGNLLQMVSYFDHATDSFPEPVCVFDKWCADPHDNPSLQIDPDGFLWLFSPSHGGWTTRSFIHRSRRPYDISEWETIADEPLFAYPQPWISPDYGWCMIHVVYRKNQRGLFVKHSRDGRRWSASRPLANMAAGHYGVSWADPITGKIGLAFDYHPLEGGLEARTNLYFMESMDWGRTWQTVEGQSLTLPQENVAGPCRVLDLESAGLLNYLRDVKFDALGNPVIVFVSSRSWQPGPESGPHLWNTVRWDGGRWVHHPAMTSDNNYDHGELEIDAAGRWCLLAPTGPGPQLCNPGGEVALWSSEDLGGTWHKIREVTSNSSHNHTFLRRPLGAHPDFAAFWADGHARQPSESHLWFCNAAGDKVRQIQPAKVGEVMLKLYEN